MNNSNKGLFFVFFQLKKDWYILIPTSNINKRIKTVIIHAYDDQINTVTGHEKRILILSIKIDREILNELNFGSIYCSDSMNNFPHNMMFRKTKGFDLVEKITTNEF
ncbi:hypothetical protein [Metabacillus litoralis]|uniref:hypothetical protein n=1 Tax=Metabacillus litoralis TaxID=152268 RepID=UPI00203CCB6F|nr:hypothetical protein [Metabacillus litoralis]MCM3654314.1 hypothetical protein [Metabacillus litoralis]